MAQALIFEFDGVGRADYDTVNERLGLDPQTGAGDWPDGMLFHAGAAKSGGWVVFEIWSSEEAQQRWMDERLGAALQEVGVAAPTRVEWLEVAAHLSRPG